MGALPLAAVTVQVSPATVSTPVYGERQFTATVTGAADVSVQWQVNGVAGGNATLGTIDATGKYVAPPVPPAGYAVTVKAVSNADPTVAASVPVQVRWQIPYVTTVMPMTMPAGPFTVTVTGSRFVSGAHVLLNGVALNTVYNSATQLTAKGIAGQPGANTLTVANPGPGAVSTPTTINVTTTLLVAVAPLTATLSPGGTAQFSAAVANNANQNVTWKATAGAIDAAGLYTAPQTVPLGGLVTIAAVSQVDNVTKGTATVTILDPQAIQIGRLLEQSTFGPTPQLMAHVRQVGIPAFLDEQFAAPESPWPPLATATRQNAMDTFFANQLNGNDQLRQRVIYALSEIIVISMQKNTNGDEIVPWLQILSKNAFGNYRTLLQEITLDASIGKYLDMVNSAKPGVAGGANENYAREVMQLFTIGLTQLQDDGTSTGLPTYDQHDVQQLALAFSGWTYGIAANTPAQFQRGSYYHGPMQPLPAYHDMTAKTLLGSPIAAAGSPQQDVGTALDILFNHPNVPPFIATRLIRALVTSNPSPQYVGRISAVFKDDGKRPAHPRQPRRRRTRHPHRYRGA